MSPDELWEAVGATFVATDFFCHTHGKWLNLSDRCSADCNYVPVFMAPEGKTRPNLRDGSDYDTPTYL